MTAVEPITADKVSPPLAGILFDFDGVLINSLPVMQLAFSAALYEVYPGHRLRQDALFTEYRKYLGMGFPEIMDRLGLSQDMFEPFRRHSRLLAPYVRLFDGTVELLEWAKQRGFVMGIATGKDFSRTIELLDQLKITHFFDEVYGSDSVAAPKPDPEMALRFCESTGLSCADVMMIGDASADIECGRRAGCLTAGVLWGYTPEEQLSALEPDFLFASPEMAIKQITKIATPAVAGL